ncbi:MAG: hypothetical protein HY795_06700 [Desulfovibrio sp.]|nr:hypothetical protein [Desulfovibrio sp.]MBI4961211.1 hypothetical protein [Desulfovibrio sp.]
MDNTPKDNMMIRRIIAYVIVFAAFHLAGTMDGIRISVQFGVFFSGLIAATILSFILFLVIATLATPKTGKWFNALVFATEMAASALILKLLLPLVPRFL